MSLVVGYIQDDVIYMGGDGRLSWGEDGDYQDVPYPRKVRVINSNMILGIVGGARALDVVYSLFEPPSTDKITCAYDYLVREFVPALRECLDNNKVPADDDGDTPVVLLVGIRVDGKATLHVVDSSFAVTTRSSKYDAIGIPSFALGALHVLSSSSAIWKIRRALETTAAYTRTVGPPYYVLRIPTEDK
jgi:hypothetical protein